MNYSDRYTIAFTQNNPEVRSANKEHHEQLQSEWINTNFPFKETPGTKGADFNQDIFVFNRADWDTFLRTMNSHFFTTNDTVASAVFRAALKELG